MNTTTSPICVDVREVAPRDRHPLIFSTFRALGVNEAMELVNDHDPKPLFYQFDTEAAGQFTWDYLERGPQTWRVRIGRLAKPHGSGQCCGHCGGA